MPEFEYQVIDRTGQKINGVISAADFSLAKKLLKEKGFLILEIKEKASKFKIDLAFSKIFQTFKIKDQDLYNTFKELSILIKAGLTIDKSLEIIIQTTPNVKLKEILEKVLKGIREGKTIAQAFSEASFLNPLIISMISAGEAIGKISSAFENIADYYRFQIQFKSELKNAITYPIFLVIASIITIFVIFRFILPRFFNLFAELTLPLPAKILYFLGKVLSFLNWYIFLAILIIFLVLKKALVIEEVKKRINPLILKGPIFRDLILNLDYSRFSYSMYSMLKSGVDFVDSLYLSKNVVLNKELKRFFESSILEIKKGRSIAEVFRESRLISPVFYNMIKVGEESGNLKEIFWELHSMYEENFKNRVKRLLSLAEPVIITLTGLLIGFIVISLILTVMSAGVIKF